LIQISCLPGRFVFTSPDVKLVCLALSPRWTKDQLSSVSTSEGTHVLADVIHDDLVAILDPKAVAYSTVTRYLREVKLGTAEVILDPEPSSPHIDDSDRTILAALEGKKSHFRPCENLPEPSISHTLPSIEGLPNRSGSYDIVFAGCRTFCRTPRR
jgi:hypothetical protein